MFVFVSEMCETTIQILHFKQLVPLMERLWSFHQVVVGITSFELRNVTLLKNIAMVSYQLSLLFAKMELLIQGGTALADTFQIRIGLH